jgi:hypothetical protein
MYPPRTALQQPYSFPSGFAPGPGLPRLPGQVYPIPDNHRIAKESPTLRPPPVRRSRGRRVGYFFNFRDYLKFVDQSKTVLYGSHW